MAGAVAWLTGVNPVCPIKERKVEDPRRGDERRVVEALSAWRGTLRDGAGRPRRWWKAAEAAAGVDADLWAAVVRRPA